MAGKSKIRVLAFGFALHSLLFAGAAAQSATAPAKGAPASSATVGPPGTRIGIVNVQEAIFTTNEGKKETDALQQRFAPKQGELKSLSDEVESLKKQLQAQGDKLNDEERGNRARAIDSKQRTLARSQEDAQNEFQQAEQEIVNKLGRKMLVVLEKYSRENGYAAVLDVSGQQNPVLWASQGNTITKDLIAAYNAASPSAPATPQGKAATSTGTPSHPAPAAPKKP